MSVLFSIVYVLFFEILAIEYLFQSRAEHRYVVGGTDVGRRGRALPQMDTPLCLGSLFAVLFMVDISIFSDKTRVS